MLDKPPKDKIMESVEKEPIVNKYFNKLGLGIIFLLVSMIIGLVSLFKYEKQDSPETYGVNLAKQEAERLVVLPYPHQSFKNVESWTSDAIISAYSFDFNDFDEQVRKASYYFTPEGFSTYQNSLLANQIRETVLSKKIQIAIVPLDVPVFINQGSFGSTEFWRLRMPVLTSYFGGREPVIQRMSVEVLVLRVPAYQNHKGLAIAEFNMLPM